MVLQKMQLVEIFIMLKVTVVKKMLQYKLCSDALSLTVNVGFLHVLSWLIQLDQKK